MLATLEEEIQAAASMASLALAILVFFTNMRRESLKTYLERVRPFGWRTIGDALPDLFLTVLTAGAVLAMAPLCFDSFSVSELGTRAGVLPSMFALIWLGFVILLAFQVGMVGRGSTRRPRPRDDTAARERDCRLAAPCGGGRFAAGWLGRAAR
jgi:hypothetical protein